MSYLDWLPSAGRVLFFYDMERQPWGFDPQDEDGSQVVYLAESSLTGGDAAIPESIEFEGIEKKWSIGFRKIELPPSWNSDEIKALRLSSAELGRFIEYRNQLYGGTPHHQVGGYADCVQGSHMQLECELVSNGLYCGDATGYKHPRAAKLARNVSDWQLLFQMDSDDDLDIMWGDVGKIYYWIRKQDALKSRFDKTWLILQCG
jgi:uncharacterized protein YwqG